MNEIKIWKEICIEKVINKKWAHTNSTIFHPIICHIKRGSPLILNDSVNQSIIDKNGWLIVPNWYNSSLLAAGRLSRDLSAWHAIFWQPVTNCCDKIFQQLRQSALEQPSLYGIPRRSTIILFLPSRYLALKPLC